MEETSSFSSPAQLIQGFNEIQNNLTGGFGAQQGISKAKEIAGNMLLTIGTPFFAERLKKHIGEDAVNAIQKYVNGEMNLGDVLDVAKSKFETDILPQAKQALFSEASKYIPGLENINLETASVNDIRNAFQTQITQKLKSALPDDIANNLPASFSQDDIINSVRQMGTDQALAYAKKTLPPDVYSKLESNQDLIRDPSKIASYINNSIAEAKGNISRLATTTQQNVAAKLNETKQALINKAEEQLAPLRDKVKSITELRQKAVDTFEENKAKLISQYEDVTNKLESFKSANPNATAEDLAPFENQIKELKASGRALRGDFLNSDKDFADQLDAAKSMLSSNTDLLYKNLNDLKSGIFTKANEVFDNARQTGTELLTGAQQTGTELLTGAQQTGSELLTGARSGANVARESLRAAESDTRVVMRQYVSPVPEEETPSMFSRFKAWGQAKIKQYTEPITRRAEDIATTPEGYKPRMMSPDEPENPFSERALTFRNPALTDYYGSELTPPNQLLAETSRPVITRGRKIRAPERPVEEAPQPRDQLAPMREMAQRNAEARVTKVPQDTQIQRQIMEQDPEVQAPPAEAPAQPVSAPTQPSAAPIQQEAPAQPTTEQAPQQTTPQQTQNLSEPLEEETSNTAMTDITQTGEKATTSIVSKIGDISKGLDEAAAATEEVPVLDILMDVGGLIGSILGGTKLLGGSSPGLPALSGSSYEPNL